MNVPVFCSRYAGALALVFAAATTAQGAGDPKQFLEDGVAEVLKIVYDQPADGQPLSARVRPILERDFDFEYTTRSAVGPAWKQFSADQQAKVVKLFGDLIMRTYVDRFEPKERPTITFGKVSRPADKRAEVASTITYEGSTYQVAYKLRELSTGWRVYDVVAENVSMIANYRAQFEELIRKGGPDALLRALEQNLLQAPPKS